MDVLEYVEADMISQNSIAPGYSITASVSPKTDYDPSNSMSASDMDVDPAQGDEPTEQSMRVFHVDPHAEREMNRMMAMMQKQERADGKSKRGVEL